MINTVINVAFVTMCVVLVIAMYRSEIIGRVGDAASSAEGVGELGGWWLSRYFVNRTYVRVVHKGDKYQLQVYSGWDSRDLGLPASRESAIADGERIRQRIDQIAEALAVDSRVVWTDSRALTDYPGP